MEDKLKIIARNLTINRLFADGFELSLDDDFEIFEMKTHIRVILKTMCGKKCDFEYCKKELESMLMMNFLKNK